MHGKKEDGTHTTKAIKQAVKSNKLTIEEANELLLNIKKLKNNEII